MENNFEDTIIERVLNSYVGYIVLENEYKLTVIDNEWYLNEDVFLKLLLVILVELN